MSAKDFAFPTGCNDHAGMTLRDWLAGQSLGMAALLVAQAVASGKLEGDELEKASLDGIAKRAYELADVMLKARESPRTAQEPRSPAKPT